MSSKSFLLLAKRNIMQDARLEIAEDGKDALCNVDPVPSAAGTPIYRGDDCMFALLVLDLDLVSTLER